MPAPLETRLSEHNLQRARRADGSYPFLAGTSLPRGLDAPLMTTSIAARMPFAGTAEEKGGQQH